jgi:hypothetical protein
MSDQSDQPGFSDPLDTMFLGLSAQVVPSVAPPGAGAVRRTVRRRAAVRRATAVAAGVAIVATVGVASAATTGPHHRQEPAKVLATATARPSPAPSPSASSSPTTVPSPSASPAAQSLRQVNWTEATIHIPSTNGGCRSGLIRFHQGIAESPDKQRYWRILRIGGSSAVASYADVNLDGSQDAVLNVDCVPQNSVGFKDLVRVQRSSNGALVASVIHSYGDEDNHDVVSWTATTGGVHATYGLFQNGKETPHPELLRWNGHGFTDITSADAFDWTSESVTIPTPFRHAPVPLGSGGTCAAGTFPTGRGAGHRTTAGYQSVGAVYATGDLNGDGFADAIVGINCGDGAYNDIFYYAYAIHDDEPFLLGYLTSDTTIHQSGGPGYRNTPWSIKAEVATTKSSDCTFGGGSSPGPWVYLTRHFRRTGSRFVADKPLPYHPNADVAP